MIDYLNAAAWADPYIDLLIAHPDDRTGWPASPTTATSASTPSGPTATADPSACSTNSATLPHAAPAPEQAHRRQRRRGHIPTESGSRYIRGTSKVGQRSITVCNQNPH